MSVRDRIEHVGMEAWCQINRIQDVSRASAREALLIVKETAEARHQEQLRVLKEARESGEAETEFDFGQRVMAAEWRHSITELLTALSDGTQGAENG